MRLSRLLFCLTLVGGLTAVQTVQGAQTDRVKRHTLKEIRDRNVIKQDLDYSCGAAALATLMSYYFGDPTDEKEILGLLDEVMVDLSEAERIRKKQNGFSLLDLKKAAEKKGYKAAGFELPAKSLRNVSAPVLVYVHPMGYHHFAVLRGVSGDQVYLADPQRGNVTMSFARFAEEYGGVVFVLGAPGEENIDFYPAALGRSDDFAEPDPERVIHRIDQLIDSQLRTRTLRAQ